MLGTAVRMLLQPFRRKPPDGLPVPPAEGEWARAVGHLDQDDQLILLDDCGVVVTIVKGDLAARLGIVAGKPLAEQVCGVTPQFQELLLNDREPRGVAAATFAVVDRSGRRVQTRLRVLPREPRGFPVALSRERELDVADALGDSVIELQEHLDIVSRIVSFVSGDFTAKEAVGRTLRIISERLSMDSVAFYAVVDYPTARLLGAFGRTRRRGVPYPPVDCTHPLLAPLLNGAPFVTSPVPRTDLPDGLDDVCTPDAMDLLLFPASTSDGVTGFLVMSRDMTCALDPSTIHTLRIASQLLGLVAQRSLLSRESERSSAVLETAYAVARTISRSLDLEHTFSVVALNAARLVPGTRCLVFELDSESGDLVAVATSQADESPLQGARLRLDGQAARELTSRRHLLLEVSNLVWGSSVSVEARQAVDARTILFVPMLACGQLIGSLALLSLTRSHSFTARDLALAEEVADQAAVAIHNARLYGDLVASRGRVEELMSRIARIREHERRNLASIVHDDIIQSVAGSVYKLEAARGSLPPHLQAPLADAITVLQKAIDEARHVISDLRPPALEGLGLAASLRTLVDRADSQGRARVGCLLDELPDLSPSRAAAVYKIAREALANAQRHSHARRIWLTAKAVPADDGRVLELTIRDDGQGLSGREMQVDEHYGFVMMEEQSALAGGRLIIEDAVGGGLSVQALIPLDRDAQIAAGQRRVR